jgi:hypothetical protein
VLCLLTYRIPTHKGVPGHRQPVYRESQVGRYGVGVGRGAGATFGQAQAVVGETGDNGVGHDSLSGFADQVGEGGEGDELPVSEQVPMPGHAIGLHSEPQGLIW